MHRAIGRVLPVLLTVICATAVLAAEGRTPVFLPGSMLAADGRYVLTRNLTGPGPVITICGADVDLDLNGMVVTNTAGGGDTITTAGCPGVVDHVTIHGGTIVAGDRGIHVPGPTRKVDIEDVALKDTTAPGGGGSSPGVPSPAAILLSDVEGAAIRRVEITDSAGYGILWNGFPVVKHGTIEHSLIRRANGYGILVDTCSSVAILNNRLEQVVGNGGLGIYNCDAPLVAENTIAQNDYGIEIHNNRGAKFLDNSIVSNGYGGMLLDHNTVGTQVLNNTFSTNGLAAGAPVPHALWIWGSRNVFEGNVVTDNGGGGLLFEPIGGPGSACGNTFGRNTARGNGGTGLPPCGAAPPGQLSPDFCDATAGGCAVPNSSYGNNLMPGPPLG